MTNKEMILMQPNTADEIYEVDKLTLLDCSKLKLSIEKSGFLTAEYDGKTYHRVDPTRLIPFKSKTTYISLSYETEEKEFREIGVIRDMSFLINSLNINTICPRSQRSIA